MNPTNLLSAELLYWILGCGLLTLVVVLWLVHWLRQHRDKETEEAATAGGAAGHELPSPAGAPETAPAFSSYALPGDLTLSFVRAIKYLRSQSTGRRRLYRVPWFLLLGQAGAGKTTLLQSLGADAAGAIESPNLRHGLGWSFFYHGVVLDVPGDSLLQPATLESHERSWRGLLRLLNRSRRHRPLDGVVLVLPVQDFLATSDLSLAELVRKARYLADKLAQLQRETAVCFPVYILISQCDQVPGFASFCAALPPARLREIFGWSSPYRADASFDPAWVDEAFEEMAQSLNRTQSELFVERLEAADPGALYLFPSEMLVLRDRLRAFLHQIFRTTAYREAYHCRGIYFTGDGPEIAEAGAPQPAAESLAGPLLRGGRLGLPLSAGWRAPRPVFLEELFERKIFPEWGLAYPETRTLSFRRGALITIQSIALAMALFLALGLGASDYHLTQLRRQALPVLESVHGIMASQPTEGASPAGLQQQAHAMAGDIAELGNNRFVFAFFPASWSRSLDRRIQNTIEDAFAATVLQHMCNELQDRAESLAAAPPAPPAVGNDASDGGPADADNDAAPPANLPIEQVPEYIAARQFVSQVETLEDNIARYQRMSTSGAPGTIEDLNALMRYLHPGSNFFIQANGDSYLAEALIEAPGPPFPEATLDATRARVRAEMGMRVDALYSAWFQNNPSLVQLKRLVAQINALDDSSDNFSYAQLQALQAALDEAEAWVNNPQTAQLADPATLFAGPLRQVTLDPVERSATLRSGLFSPTAEIEDAMRNGAQADWQTLHDQLTGLSTDLTGPMLEITPQGMRLSPGVESLRLPIVNLMSLSFMANDATAAFGATIPPHSSLTWDPGPLQDALGMVSDYRRYLQEGLLQAPDAVRQTFRQLAAGHLTASLDNQLAQAEIWKPAPSSAADLDAAVKNFQTAEPMLDGLLQDSIQLHDNDTHAELQGLLNQQAFGLLAGLDAELSADAPYEAQGNWTSWHGDRPAALAAFDLRDLDDLNGYLAFQRQRLEAVAADGVPLVTFLQQSPQPGRTPQQIQLFNQWQSLTTDVQQYENKLPGNPLSKLEDFLLTDMDQMLPASHCRTAAPPADRRPDYFLQIRAQLWRDGYARCREIDANTAHQGYAAVAEQFNRTLAGKFPFGELGPAGTAEANPEDITAFYAQLDQAQPSFGAQLRPDQAAFIQQMNALRPLWSAFLSHAVARPVLDVTPTFRVNRARERGGNQIMNWTLKIGAQTFSSGTPATSERWILGDPVTLTLQWASDSPQAPVAAAPGNGGGPVPVVDHRAVTYTNSDAWSLLAMVRQWRAPASDFPLLQDPAPNTLAFPIATQPAGAPRGPVGKPAPATALVFIRLAIQPPGGVESVRIPEFPQRAPLGEAGTDAGSHSY